MIRAVKADFNEYGKVTKGCWYEVSKIDNDGDIWIHTNDGDTTWYRPMRFNGGLNYDAIEGDYVYCDELDVKNLAYGNIYKITGHRVDETEGLFLEVKDDVGRFVEWPPSVLKVAKSVYVEAREKVVALRINKIGDSGNVRLTKGAEYEVVDIRGSGKAEEFLILCDDGLKRWYSAFRFTTTDEFRKELEEIREELVRQLKMKENDDCDLDDSIITNKKESAEAQKETSNMTMTTKLTERFGTFGMVEGVAMTMTGKLAFLGMDSNYYSFEDGVLVANEDMVIDGMPAFAMPVLKSTLKAGDLIIQKDGTFTFVNKDLNFVKYDGTVITVATQKHAMFGNAMDFVSKVMDMNMGSMFGNGTATTADNSNPFANPMFMLMMFGKDDKKDSSDMMKNFMMMNMFSNMNNNGNAQANPMMAMAPIMFMGGDKSGDKNEMMKMVFLSQLMQNQQKATEVK